MNEILRRRRALMGGAKKQEKNFFEPFPETSTEDGNGSYEMLNGNVANLTGSITRWKWMKFPLLQPLQLVSGDVLSITTKNINRPGTTQIRFRINTSAIYTARARISEGEEYSFPAVGESGLLVSNIYLETNQNYTANPNLSMTFAVYLNGHAV